MVQLILSHPDFNSICSNDQSEWKKRMKQLTRRKISTKKKNSIMHSIYFFSVVVFGFDIFMWKFASATLFSMLFQWLNELLSFTRFLISKLWWKWLSICGLNSKKNTKTATTSRLCISFTHSVNTNKSIILWFAFIKSHHWKWISLLAWRYFAALFSVNQNYRDQMIFFP